MLQTLLVDDDILSLNQLNILLSELSFIRICGQFQNGTATLEYLEKYGDATDLIILDMEMPGASGLDVAAYISRKNFPITILVISNFDNFEYVKPVLQAGAYDYLLKHELSRSLLETKLAEIRDYREVEQLHQKQRDKIYQLSRQQYLKDVVLDYPVSKESHIFFSAEPGLSGRRHVAACLQITNFSSIYHGYHEERRQKVIDTVLHFCDTYFASLQRGIIVHINYGEFLILLSFPTVSSEAMVRQMAYQDLNLLKRNLQRYLSIHSLIEFMPVFDLVQYLRPYYLKLHHKLQAKPFESGQEKREKKVSASGLLSLQHENELTDAILHLNEKKGVEILTEIFESIKTSNVSLFQLQQLIARLTELMQLALQTTRIDGKPALPKPVSNILDIDSLKEYFIQYYRVELEHLAAVSTDAYPPMIQKALNYIYQNYHRDISLSDISSYCGVTDVYFSRAFKDAVGQSFIKYLNSYRIKIAARLLLQSRDSLRKIAEDSGFQSYNYFLTVFKTYTGMTPAEYREQES